MFDASATLNKIVSGKKVFRVIIADTFERAIFPIFRSLIVHDRHTNLNVGVVGIIAFENKIAFEFADSGNANVVSFGTRVDIDNILQRRSVVNSFVRIKSEIETKIGEIVFLFSREGFS